MCRTAIKPCPLWVLQSHSLRCVCVCTCDALGESHFLRPLQVRNHSTCEFGKEPCMSFKPWCAHRDTFRVYVYPDESLATMEPAAHVRSPQMAMLLDALRGSKYATEDPSAACLFIPSLDTLCTANKCHVPEPFIAAILYSLPHWNNGVLNS